MPLLVVLIPLGMICPYFGNDGVLVFIVFNGHREAHVLLYRVLDLVELLPNVVGRVVLRAGRRRPVVVALFPPAAHAPQQNGDEHEDPDDNEDGAEEGHQIVCRRKTRTGQRAAASSKNRFPVKQRTAGFIILNH